MKQRGQLIIMSGFSGSGKGTITQALLERYPQEYALSVSATTRQPREGEKDGIHYFFLSKKDFETKIQKHEFLEYACYVDDYYGTPADYVEQHLASGKNVILEIEIQGALQVKKKVPDALLVFVTPPTAEILENRLRGRGTESEDVIASRMSRAAVEADGCEVYDYLVVNDDLDASVALMHQIIQYEKEKPVQPVTQCENSKMKHQIDLISKIRTELKEKAKGE